MYLILTYLSIYSGEGDFHFKTETDDEIRDCKLYMLIIPVMYGDYYGKGEHLN